MREYVLARITFIIFEIICETPRLMLKTPSGMSLSFRKPLVWLRQGISLEKKKKKNYLLSAVNPKVVSPTKGN